MHRVDGDGARDGLRSRSVGMWELPDGSHLLWARYEASSDGLTFGMVRYEGPSGTPRPLQCSSARGPSACRNDRSTDTLAPLVTLTGDISNENAPQFVPDVTAA